MPIVWIVLPVMVFLVLSGVFGRTLSERHRWTLFAIAGLAAGLAGAATSFPLAHPGHWQDHLQFAWIGVHGESGKRLTIGGAATETENIGWPGNFRFPEVRLTPGTGDMLEIETSSHSGFVRRESDNKILNGQLVAEGGNAVTTFTEDGVEHHFQFEFRPCFSRWTFRGVMEFWAEIPSCLSIYLDGGKDSLTQAEEGRFGFRPIGKERAEFVSGFVDQAVRRMRQEGANHDERDKKAAQAGLLERWAASVELSARESKAGKELYFLTFDPGHEGTDDRFSNDEIASGSEITILWPRNKLSMAVRKNTSNKIDVAFDAPYRHSTPLPPGKPELGINDKKTLALKRTLAPGDIAFLLPFPAKDGFDEKPVDAIEKSVIQRKIQIPILHETSVPYRGFDLIFKSIDAVPRADRLSLSGNRATLLDVMALGILTLLGGLACLFASRLPIDRKAMYASVVLATWGIVCIRFLLAFRFSFDPAQMDKYSAQQMYSGMHALILIPGAVALCCLFATVRVRSPWMIRELVVSSAVLLVTLGHWFARHLWVELPNSIIAADRNEFVAPALIVVLVIAMVRSGQAPRAGNNGQESLFALFFQWETHNRFRLLKEIGVIILWIFIALVAGRIASHFPWPPVRSFTKEVLLAAMQCGTVWYALRGIDTKNSAAFASRTFCRWCIVFFIVSSISLDDVGGIMAGWSFLISLAVIALVAHFQKGRRYRFKWTRELSVAAIPIVIIGLAGMAGWAACQTTWLDKGKEFVDTPATQRIFHWLDANDKDVQAQEIAEKYYRASGRSNEQELSETDEQTWQNQAMIVLGGWRGVGFGNAPVHRSAIPQHTLQADSTYSFFIGSEYGRRGGIALILLFAFPLIAVIKGSWRTGLRNAPERMAAIIMSAFFLEMLTHVLMNMEVLPMTGRNMPLLSTQSPANTVRWVALLCFACVCWARSGAPEPPRTALRLARWFSLEEASALLVVGLMVLVLALGMGAWTKGVEETAFASTGRLSPEEKERFKTLSEAERWKGALIFTRSAYMNEARLYITRQAGEEPVLRIERDRDGNPWLHNDDGQLKLDDFKHTKLAEEAQRFNGLPLSRRLPAEPSADECSHVAPQEQEGCLLRSRGACVDESHGDKHAYMRCLFNREIGYRKTHQAGRPSLFELTHELFADIDQQYENTAPPETDINPAFQNVIDFALYDMSQLPSVVFSNPDGGGVGWRISMAGSQFTVTGSRERRHETAAFQARDGHLTPRLGQARFAGSVDIALTNCSHPNPTRRPKGTAGTEVVVTLDVDEEGRLWGQPHMKVASTSHGRHERTGRMEFTDGERYETATNACGLAEKPAWSVERMRNPNELIGKAWENGEWKLTWRRTPNIPWVSTLAHALPNPAIQKELPGANAFHEYRLTLDPVLQDSAGKFLDGLAAAKYFDVGTRKLIPFRAGIAVLDMSNGEVLASVGWPHLSGDDLPRLDAGGVLEPAEEWISTEAPGSLRIRFMGDHNLEALPVGSASKPMWAAAALSVNPALAQMRTRKTEEDDGQEKEAQLFGVDVKPGWVLENRGKDEKACCGLDEYLAYSDNRFQTRLNFSALAEQQQGKMKLMTAGPPESRPPHESFDGGRTWGGIPDLSRLGFRPRDLKGGDWETRLDEGPNGDRLADADLARNMHNFYPVEVESTSPNPVYHSLSFWTGRNQDDTKSDVFAAVMGGISPQQTNLALDNVRTARDLVTILLGGGTNRWSNIELASGFYTALTGDLLVPHIVSMQDKTDPAPRNPLPNDVRGKLERGLNGVVTWPGATATDKMKDAVNAYRKQGGFELYAKTGTLAEANPKTGETRYWSRILLAITPHQMGAGKAPWSGLLIAVYVGDADMGTASKWANDFLVGDARQEIEFLLARSRSRLRDSAQR